MNHLAKISRWVVIGSVFCLIPFAALALEVTNPCTGKGTKIFFVNGIFDNNDQAKYNLDQLITATQPSLSSVNNLQYDLAWVENSWKPLQLAETAVQRGVDDFQRYWLWLYGLEEAPSWFEAQVQSIVTDSSILNRTVLPRLKDHLELYSNAILQGYQVIIVSHSAGGFYANVALRDLPEYTPDALQTTLLKRHQDNPDYPETESLVANIQIATPVGKTENNSPWVNFKDDQVLNWIRHVVNVLPGNINSPGTSASDLRGHGLDSYLRVDESRNLIIKDILDAHTRLKYPIPFFQNAATVEYPRAKLGFDASFFIGPKEITEVNERTDGNGGRMTQFIANCRDLRAGDVDIRATSIVQTAGEKNFMATGYVGNADQPGGTSLQMINPQTISHWRLGRMRVLSGRGKDPIEVEVKFLPNPELIK